MGKGFLNITVRSEGNEEDLRLEYLPICVISYFFRHSSGYQSTTETGTDDKKTQDSWSVEMK